MFGIPPGDVLGLTGYIGDVGLSTHLAAACVLGAGLAASCRDLSSHGWSASCNRWCPHGGGAKSYSGSCPLRHGSRGCEIPKDQRWRLGRFGLVALSLC